MFALLFDHDRNVGAKITGNRIGGEPEIRGSGTVELQATRNCLQIPVAVAAGISLYEDTTRSRMRLYVLRSALDFHFATRCVRLDARTGLGHANDTREGAHAHIAFDVRHSYASGSGRYMDVAANIFSRHGTASGGKLSVALDFLDADGPGGGFHFHRSAHIANGLSARRNGDIHVRVVWHLDGVCDGDVAHARHFFADADGVAPLLDGRIRNGLVQPLLWIVKSKTRRAHIGIHRHPPPRISPHLHVTAAILDLP